MDCAEATQRLVEALEGGLSQSDSSRLGEHLSRCASCCAEFEMLRKGSDALIAATPELAPRERYLTTARLDRLMAACLGRPMTLRIITFRRFVAAAAVAVILVSGFFIAGDVARIWRAERQEPLIVLDWLGVAVAAQEPEGREGLEVKAVLEDSPAHAAGIQPADVLLQVEDRAIDDLAVLAYPALYARRSGTVVFQVFRNNRIETVPVEVNSRPLLLYAGAGGPADGIVRLRWKAVGAFWSAPPGSSETGAVQELQEENERLRQRVHELEQSINPPAPAGR